MPVSQLIILNFVHKKVSKSSFLSLGKLHIRIINKAAVIIQLGITALLLVILFEATLSFTYDLILLKAVFISSFLTATFVMALLSSLFIIWLKSNRSRLTLAYMLASLCLTISAVIGIDYVSKQLTYDPEVVHPKPFGEFITHSTIRDSSLANAYAISSAIAFVLLWIGTVFLLHSYRKRLSTIKYWIIMKPAVIIIAPRIIGLNKSNFDIIYNRK